MKIMFAIVMSLLGLFADGQALKMHNSTPINDGEVLEFRLSYGWFTVGRAKWTTNVVDYEGDECYKARVTAKSSGLLGVFAKVDDEWGEYARTDDFMPKMAWRDLEEGKYILDEKTYFDYDNMKIKYDKTRKGVVKPTKYMDIEQARVGMLGGFMQMRSVDYSQYKVGDVIKVEAFFEGEPYDVEVVLKGKEKFRSKVGRIMAYKIVPRLPENRLFPGKDPITMWVSADKNQLPLRADARMSFGTAYVELTGYKNVKFGPDYD